MSEITQTMEVTLYGYADNDPPGTAIAYPTLHSHAGGTGTFDDPITMASAPGELPVGTKVYVPYLQKYFIMEDYCADSVSDWRKGEWHIDLWAGGTAKSDVNKLTQAEFANTREAAQVIINPTADHPVDTTPIFSDGTTTPTPPATTQPPTITKPPVVSDTTAPPTTGHSSRPSSHHSVWTSGGGTSGQKRNTQTAHFGTGSQKTLGYAAASWQAPTSSDTAHDNRSALLGQYAASSFVTSAGTTSGTPHDRTPSTLAQTLTQPHHRFG